MLQETNSSSGTRLYRINKFAGPSQSREKFLDFFRKTNEVLRAEAGFVQAFCLEAPGEPGEFNIVSVVEMESEAVAENMRVALAAMNQRMKITPKELLAELGIKAEQVNYKRLDM